MTHSLTITWTCDQCGKTAVAPWADDDDFDGAVHMPNEWGCITNRDDDDRRDFCSHECYEAYAKTEAYGKFDARSLYINVPGDSLSSVWPRWPEGAEPEDDDSWQDE